MLIKAKLRGSVCATGGGHWHGATHFYIHFLEYTQTF
jgi:hypothetical protein